MDENSENDQARKILEDAQKTTDEYKRSRNESEDLGERIEALLKERASRDRFNRESLEGLEAEALTRASVEKAIRAQRFRLVMILLGVLMAAAGTLVIAEPKFVIAALDNVFASLLTLSGFAFLIVAYLLGMSGGPREKTFVDIDDKLQSSRFVSMEVERDQLLKQVEELRFELNNNYPGSAAASTKPYETGLPEGLKLDFGTLGGIESKGFDVYLKSIIRSLEENIELADKKASLLLDKGTTYLWRGILFYISSIVVWQVATAYFKVGDYAVWGMISCSMTFLVVEFLAAWFLRQYKSFTDSSFNLVRVKSVFNRYFLSYLAIKEFSDSSLHLAEMRVQILKVLEEDVKWLDPVAQKTGDLNHMVAMFESVSGLVEKLKSSSKKDSTAAP